MRLENLPAGDYELFLHAEDLAGNRSAKMGPEKFTIYAPSQTRPRLNDFSRGKGSYSQTSRPVVSGNAGQAKAHVQIFETGNYAGSTLSDEEGNFTWIPQEDLKNG